MKLCKKCSFPVFSGDFCIRHQYMRTDRTPKKAKRGPLKNNYKKTGEMDMFKEIVLERGPFSQISGVKIENISHENFHHILPKGKYPKFKLYKKNIVILSNDEHFCIHFGCKSDRIHDGWNKYYQLEDELKQEYDYNARLCNH